MWQSVFKGATHCDAGCALGDWLAFVTGLALFGYELGGKFLPAFVLAYLFGIVFQYSSVAPMRKLGVRDGLIAAVKINTLSLLAYEVGMYAPMSVQSAWNRGLQPTSWSYWPMMQVAMVLGFLTTYPVN